MAYDFVELSINVIHLVELITLKRSVKKTNKSCRRMYIYRVIDFLSIYRSHKQSYLTLKHFI